MYSEHLVQVKVICNEDQGVSVNPIELLKNKLRQA